MKLLTLTNVLGAAKLAYAAPSTDLTSVGMFPQEALEVADLPPPVLASSTQVWKVGDVCVGGGSPGTCVQEDLGGFSKPACPNDISFFGCGSGKDATSWGQAVNSMRCCVQRRCAPPWDKYFCKNTYKSIMPNGFHIDPDLCRAGADVLCWIEPVAEGDPPPSGMTTPGYQAGAPDPGDSESDLKAAGFGGGDSSNDLGWLASGTSVPLEGKLSDYGPGDMLEGISDSGDFFPGLDDSQPDYSIFSR